MFKAVEQKVSFEALARGERRPFEWALAASQRSGFVQTPPVGREFHFHFSNNFRQFLVSTTQEKGGWVAPEPLSSQKHEQPVATLPFFSLFRLKSTALFLQMEIACLYLSHFCLSTKKTLFTLD